MPESTDQPAAAPGCESSAATAAFAAFAATRPPHDRGWSGDNAVEALIKTIRRACHEEGKDFRARCLKDHASARTAVEEAGGIQVPEHMCIMFIERFPEPNCAVVLLPPTGELDEPSIHKALRCCYQPY